MKKIYIANAQGYCLEFRLSENKVNSYNAYKTERDKAKYVNNGWVPFQDWCISKGTFYTADSTNFNNQRAPASDRNGWCYGDEGFGYNTRRMLYTADGNKGLYDALQSALGATTGISTFMELVQGVSKDGSYAVHWVQGLFDTDAWSKGRMNAYILLVRPL